MMIYDVSMLIHDKMQVYKNKEDKRPIFKNALNHIDNQVHETNLYINLHTGTHVDYPLHMIDKGDTSDSESLLELIGSCKVLDLTELDSKITINDLKKYPIEEDDFLFFKTKNSLSEEFLHDFVYLDKEAAQYLKDKKIRGVGTDGLGIERSQPNHETHKILLSNGIIIIEGLRLKDIIEKEYEMICLPLKIKSVEASLARVILMD
ncbi:cyclase family protein [Hujiaoplasma nucleasis]|uniref:Kynurenine formamidase n=2 Tax=Hujiaoplasma nucleasis TaxID=2725268 RepID=A0A7L6N3J2_9MOLU|nr:cyclase family protein [Hujiaoplasma nucleasis]